MEEGIMSKNRKTAIFFIHGGPGLSSSCFQGWFEQLEETYDLIFYDQNYDVPKGISIIESLCTELKNKVCDVAKKYDEIIVFAHSWGVYLLLKSVENMMKQAYWAKISKFILSNPSDTNWNYFCESGDRLFAKMPEEVINRVSICNDGLDLMKMAMPYYVGDCNNVPEIKIDRYDMVAYNRISEEMENYDVGELAKLLPNNRTYTIYCENDFENISGSPELAKNSVVIEFPKAGHFPFAECQDEYINVLKEILDR